MSEEFQKYICPANTSAIPSHWLPMVMPPETCQKVALTLGLPPKMPLFSNVTKTLFVSNVPITNGDNLFFDEHPVGEFLAQKLTSYAEYTAWADILRPEDTTKSIWTAWHGMTWESVNRGILTKARREEFIRRYGIDVPGNPNPPFTTPIVECGHNPGHAMVVVNDLTWCVVTSSNASVANKTFQWMHHCIDGAAHTTARLLNVYASAPLNATSALDMCTLSSARIAPVVDLNVVDGAHFAMAFSAKCLHRTHTNLIYTSQICHGDALLVQNALRSAAAMESACASLSSIKCQVF